MESVNFRVFDSLGKLAEAIQSPEIPYANNAWEGDTVLSAPVSKWSGNLTYDEAFGLMLNGWSEGAKKIKAQGKIKTDSATVSCRQIITNPIGFAPCVPNYINGTPNAMINFVDEPVPAKPVLTIVVSVDVFGATKTSQMTEAAAKIAGVITAIEAQGVRCNLFALMGSDYHGKGGFAALCKIKDSGAPLNLLNIAFPLTHISFARIISFRAEEVISQKYDETRGRPIKEPLFETIARERGFKYDCFLSIQEIISLGTTVENLTDKVNKILS